MNKLPDIPTQRTSIGSPHEGVTQVQEVAKRRGFRPPQYKVNCLAYNPFRRADDTWWISPTGRNPAYQFPKIAFNPTTGPIWTPHLFVGLNIEKGLTGAARVRFYCTLKSADAGSCNRNGPGTDSCTNSVRGGSRRAPASRWSG